MEEIGSIRNVAFAGHSSSGKTTLIEGLLYLSDAKKRLGRVIDGNTTTDYQPDEISRGFSISTTLASFRYKDITMNIIDNPGYLDFLGELIASVRASDILVILVDATSGVEVGTERAFHFAKEAGISIVIFINGLDKERASYESTLRSVKSSFEDRFIPVNMPIGEGSSFKGVCDVISMRSSILTQDKPQISKIPDELKDDVQRVREAVMEAVCEITDELTEKFLEEGEISEDELRYAFKKSVANSSIIPVFCGCAYNLVGVDLFLNAIIENLPSPDDKEEIKAYNKDGGEVKVKISETEPFLAYVFKTLIDPYAGKLSYIRVFSGKVATDMNIFDFQKERTGKVGSLLKIFGKETSAINELKAGDIGALAKFDIAQTGDTLTDPTNPLRIEEPVIPPPVMFYAVSPKSKADEDKLSSAVARIQEEDLTFKIERNVETGENVVSGMGELHLNIMIERMKARYGVDVDTKLPRVSFRETIKRSAKAQGRYKKQTGGRGQYGDVWLEIQPLAKGEGFVFENRIVGGVVPSRYIPAVEKGIRGVIEKGVIAGYPVCDIKAILYDGSYHSVDSSDLAFQIAASMGFKKAFEEAMPTILEPIMEVEVIVPEEFMGDIMGDISGKRGKVFGMEPYGKLQKIKALVPLSEMFRYSIELRSMTQGRGTFSMKFAIYEEAPPDIQKRLVEEYSKEKEEGK
ncbi:MAG: elongation factor G [bacterium]